MVKRQNNAELKKVSLNHGRVSAPISKKEILMYEQGKTLENSVLMPRFRNKYHELQKHFIELCKFNSGTPLTIELR